MEEVLPWISRLMAIPMRVKYRKMKTKHNLTLGLLLAVLWVCCTGTAKTDPNTSPNIIFILTDDQGWTHVSHPADPRFPDSKSDYYETPNIDRLASSGITFTRGYAPNPICSPTRHSVMFGQNAARHIYNQDKNWYKHSSEKITIPKILKQAKSDYETAHFGKWHVALLPTESGFDQHDGMTSNGAGNVFGEGRLEVRPYAKATKQYLDDQGLQRPTGITLAGKPSAYWNEENPKDIFGMTERAMAFMKASLSKGKPFYVQVSHYATHLALSAQAKTYEHFLKKDKGSRHSSPEFAAMLKDMDTSIGMILDFLEKQGIAENTYVFLMGDNGGRRSLNQIAVIDQNKKLRSAKYSLQPTRNLPLRDGKHSFYEGGLRVPFLVKGPGITPNRISHVAVTGLDLLPTFAELAGYQGALPRELDGGSLVPLLRDHTVDQVQRSREALLFHQGAHRKPRSAIMKGKYKLIKYWIKEPKYPGSPKIELFNIEEDLAETKDLTSQHPALAADLEAELLQFLEEVQAETKRINIEDPFDRLVSEK